MKYFHSKYLEKGLIIVGPHAPEFDYERKRENVERGVSAASLAYPIALDSENSALKLYGNHYWPRQTLIDTVGTIGYEHVGEGDYDEIESKIVELMGESPRGRCRVKAATVVAAWCTMLEMDPDSVRVLGFGCTFRLMSFAYEDSIFEHHQASLSV